MMKNYSNIKLVFISCLLLLCLPFISLQLKAQNIPAPQIICISTDQSTGDVTINWQPYTPDACGPFQEYVILGATSMTGNFTFVGNVVNPASTSFNHVGANATLVDWYYKIVALHNCPGTVSDTSIALAEEVLDIPPINYVTVLDDGSVEVNWKKNTSSQTQGYNIYYFLGGGLSNLIDSVFGINDTVYVDLNANSDSSSFVYSVASFDVCKNLSLINPNAHNTIFLAQNIIPCTSTLELSWNPYINWPSGTRYLVEAKIDANPVEILDTLPDNSTGFNVNTNDLLGDSVCFRIIALHPNNNFTSASNKICLPITFVRTAGFTHFRNITVNASGGVDLSWWADSTADLTQFVYQKANNPNALSDFDSVLLSAPFSLLNSFTDINANTQDDTLYYQVITKDVCNQNSISGIGSPIFLKAELVGNSLVSLNWSNFTMPNATVLRYNVQEIVNNNAVGLGVVGPLENIFEENIAEQATETGLFCYQIEAEYELSVPGFPNETLNSLSNIACVEREPVIFMPNALVPGGANPFAKPVLQVPNVSQYEFVVFDRWGKIMFETNSLNAAWDGTNKGEELPFGVYTYYIKAVSQQGKEIEKKGSLVLVR